MFGYTGTITGTRRSTETISNNNNNSLPRLEATPNPTSQFVQQNLQQNTTNAPSKKRRQEIGQRLLSKAKRQKTTPDPTLSSQQELQSTSPQKEASSANSSSENTPPISNALEKTSSTQPKIPNQLEDTSSKKTDLFTITKIVRILEQGESKTLLELLKELPDETNPRISNSLCRLWNRGLIDRTLIDPSKSHSPSNPYRYSYIPPNSKDPSKTNDSIASVEATQTVALSQLAPKKTLSNLTALEYIIFDALQDGPKIVEDFTPLTSCSTATIQNALTSLLSSGLISRKYKECSSKRFVYFIPPVDSSNEPSVNELTFLEREIMRILTETKYLTCKDLSELIKNPETGVLCPKSSVDKTLKKLLKNKKIDRTKTIEESDGTTSKSSYYLYFILSASNEASSYPAEIPSLDEVIDDSSSKETLTNHSTQTTTTTLLEPLVEEIEIALPDTLSKSILEKSNDFFMKIWSRDLEKYSTNPTDSVSAVQSSSNFGDPINFIKT